MYLQLWEDYKFKINRYLIFYSRYKKLKNKINLYSYVETLDNQLLNNFFSNLKDSESQNFQDLFVLNQLNYKKNGFFVEFGAFDGVWTSNTHLLEYKFNWDGILAEPAKKLQTALKKNRSVKIETDCVWTKTGETLIFNETDNSPLSTIDSFSVSDKHKKKRAFGNKYDVRTISLLDLLIKHNAPQVIDYLSIDTEGSEFEILNAFDFKKYQFRIITCEHNCIPGNKHSIKNRQKIYDLLTSNGYKRVLTEFSKYDDWYILKEQP